MRLSMNDWEAFKKRAQQNLIPHIFISYSHQDRAFVEQLARDLQVKGIQVWLDLWEMQVGDSLIQKINQGIEGSDYLLVVLSPDSVRSKWVREELSAGLIRQLEDQDVQILPALLHKCEIPLLLRHRIYADFSTDYASGLEQLVRVFETYSGEVSHQVLEQNIERAKPKWSSNRLILNRILLSLCAAAFLVLALLSFLPVAEPVLAIIGMLAALITFLFPGVKYIHERPWFRSLWVTIAMSLLVMVATGMDAYLLLQPSEEALRIALIDTRDLNGQCGAYCTVTIEGRNISRLTPGQLLAAYGPHARLSGGLWSETPIAIVQVLSVEGQIAFAQVLLVHESANTDDSKRLVAGLRVSSNPGFTADFLVPAFGDGYVYQDYIVYLRPGTNIQVGDRLVTLIPQVRGQRVVDYLLGQTRLQITALGQEGVSAETKLISGPPPKGGDIVQIEAAQDTPEK